MNKQQEIIQIMQSTPVKGLVAKRFFHVTAPQRHVDNIVERLESDEQFYCFILLPNSKKQPTEALICTDKRIIIWNNELADDDEIKLDDIESTRLDEGWFSTTLYLYKRGTHQALFWKFKCEKEIIATFEQATLAAIKNFKH